MLSFVYAEYLEKRGEFSVKKLITLALALAMVLSLCACGGAAPEETTAALDCLQVGFAREIVMPEGTPVLDGTAAGRIMASYSDQPSVTCVAVSGANGETVLLFSMDKLTSDEVWTAPVRKEVSEATGISEDRIMLAATHTHSAPTFSGWDGSEKYKSNFHAAMAKVGVDALADRSPSQMYFGSVETDHLVFVRQYKLLDGTVTSSGAMFGDPNIVGHVAENDEELQVVRFAREEGKKDVILMNFNAHPTWHGSVTGTNMSADYPAPAREFIEARGDYLVAFFLGDAGNQAPNTKYMPEIASAAKDYREHGQRLGQYVLDLIPQLTKAEGEDVTLVSQQYSARSNKSRLEMLPQAQEVVAVYRSEGRDAANALAEKYGLYQHFEASAIIKRTESPETNEVFMNVMSIGDQLSFAFAPYEMFSENGAHIRANTPYDMTFLVTCCNGREGYIPSSAAFAYGCYESYTTQFEAGSGEIISDEFIAMLTKLKNG